MALVAGLEAEDAEDALWCVIESRLSVVGGPIDGRPSRNVVFGPTDELLNGRLSGE